jgi:hypothetical protein
MESRSSEGWLIGTESRVPRVWAAPGIVNLNKVQRPKRVADLYGVQSAQWVADLYGVQSAQWVAAAGDVGVAPELLAGQLQHLSRIHWYSSQLAQCQDTPGSRNFNTSP